MKDRKNETIKNFRKSTDNLARYVADAAYKFWERPDFRLYVEFGNLSQTEQDRILNELEVSALGLYILHIDHLVYESKDSYSRLYEMLREDLISAFLAIYAKAGVEARYIKQWEKLIYLRLDEYKEDLLTVLDESNGMVEFGDDEALRNTWARIETVTIGCLQHVRRGKVASEDPMWVLLRKWFISLNMPLQNLGG